MLEVLVELFSLHLDPGPVALQCQQVSPGLWKLQLDQRLLTLLAGLEQVGRYTLAIEKLKPHGIRFLQCPLDFGIKLVSHQQLHRHRFPQVGWKNKH